MMPECEKNVFLWLQSVHKKITTENASSTHLIDLSTCFCFMPQHQYFSHITAVVNLTTLFLDLRPPYDQRKLCDRAEVQTRVSAVRGAADCASDHSS